jgi:SAM-dependent methyltransferase
MDFFELVQISTQHLELTSPAAPEKLWSIGRYLGLNKSKNMIDFGCGYGRALELWAKDFEVTGIGIDVHCFLCERAVERINESNLSDRVEIVCGNAADYEFEQNSFDVAVCLGASFIWGGFRSAVRAMKNALKENGKVVVGEPY